MSVKKTLPAAAARFDRLKVDLHALRELRLERDRVGQPVRVAVEEEVAVGRDDDVGLDLEELLADVQAVERRAGLDHPSTLVHPAERAVAAGDDDHLGAAVGRDAAGLEHEDRAVVGDLDLPRFVFRGIGDDRAAERDVEESRRSRRGSRCCRRRRSRRSRTRSWSRRRPASRRCRRVEAGDLGEVERQRRVFSVRNCVPRSSRITRPVGSSTVTVTSPSFLDIAWPTSSSLASNAISG